MIPKPSEEKVKNKPIQTVLKVTFKQIYKVIELERHRSMGKLVISKERLIKLEQSLRENINSFVSENK